MSTKDSSHLIQRTRGWQSLDLVELWEYRELVLFLAWRDISSRYSQTVMGVLWAIAQPAVSVATLSLILGKLAKLPSDGVPYALFSFAAILVWQYVAAIVMQSVQLSAATSLMTKVYFPRLAVPLALLLPPMVDKFISVILFIATLVLWGKLPDSNVCLLPLFFGLLMLTCLAIALWISALVIRFRDLKHVFPLLLQVFMFVTPVMYASSVVPENWRLLYYANPIAVVVDGYRWCFFNTPPLPWQAIIQAVIISVTLLFTGTLAYCNVCKTITDHI